MNPVVNDPVRPRICIIALDSYGALRGGSSGHIGGAERQTTITARWLVERGYQVCLVTWNEGNPVDEEIDGIRVLKICTRNAGLPITRFFVPRLTSFLAALRRADADLYYHNSAEYHTGLIAEWCRRNNRTLVYSVANDAALDSRLPMMSRPYERWLYRRGLRRANSIIVQTEHQRRLLRENFRRDSTALPMPCPGPSDSEYVTPQMPHRKRVAWIARIVSQKRFEWLVNLAVELPDFDFNIASGIVPAEEPAQSLRDRAIMLPNVHWHGAVPREKMPSMYQGSICLCCTSSFEGFPNTFLEAWSHGVPVVTSFDPDGIVARNGLGLVGKSYKALKQALQEVCSTSNTWTEMSARCRAYYVENHRLETVLPKFEAEFLRVLGNRAKPRRTP